MCLWAARVQLIISVPATTPSVSLDDVAVLTDSSSETDNAVGLVLLLLCLQPLTLGQKGLLADHLLSSNKILRVQHVKQYSFQCLSQLHCMLAKRPLYRCSIFNVVGN